MQLYIVLLGTQQSEEHRNTRIIQDLISDKITKVSRSDLKKYQNDILGIPARRVAQVDLDLCDGVSFMERRHISGMEGNLPDTFEYLVRILDMEPSWEPYDLVRRLPGFLEYVESLSVS